ncbi:MAG: hypothetical protein Pg6C_11770 [Treponemataceae bacterium]|nr:MAG: hypothetical protein Pg6C_11770 [Treponemataceae bacterium]
MKDWQSLAHTKWGCKYHAVIVLKYRKKVLYGGMKKRTGAAEAGAFADEPVSQDTGPV